MSWPLKKINYGIFLALGLVLLLRLPTFFEPYYDGDEGVYYILGQMMQRGAVLYRDIWDNKTPLLYMIYAINPTLWWAKLTATLCVLGTSLGTYYLGKKLKINGWLVALLTGTFLSMPILAGNTANAELYFTLPIILGAFFLFTNRVNGILLGLLAAWAFNLKVPAIFDFAGLFLAYTIIHWRWQLRYWVKFYLPVAAAFAAPLLGFALYFYSRSALADFIAAAFIQNRAYVSVWSGPLGKLGNPLIIYGAILLAAVAVLTILLVKKRVSQEVFFLAVWLGFSTYATLLSGRPYPHYLLQIAAPLMLLTVYLVTNLKRYWPGVIALVVGAILVGRMFASQFYLANFWSYYQNFFDFASERKTWEQYQGYFGQDNIDAYQMAGFLRQNSKPNEPAFVWGENDYMYILSGRFPAAKFIRAHHLTTIDVKNFDLTMARLQKFQPKFILIARPVTVRFDQLEIFVHENYRFVALFGNYYIYQNVNRTTLPPWSPNY